MIAVFATAGLLLTAPVQASAAQPAASAVAFQLAINTSTGAPAIVIANAQTTVAAVTAPPDSNASVASIAAQ